MFNNLFSNIKREPLAAAAIILTIVLSILQSEWFNNLFEKKIHLNAYYKEKSDGRCSLVAFSVDNETDKTALDIKIKIVVDYLVRKDYEDIGILNRDQALIGPEEKTIIPKREVLNVKHKIEGETLTIDALLPAEYVDLFFVEYAKSPTSLNGGKEIDVARIRKENSNNPRYKFTPRIDHATFQDGTLKITNHGDCIKEIST